MAIDASDVEISSNTSISHNLELIACLSLVVFQNAGVEQFAEPGVCPCENRKCNKCSVEVNLAVSHPVGSDITNARMVTVADLVSTVCVPFFFPSLFSLWLWCGCFDVCSRLT